MREHRAHLLSEGIWGDFNTQDPAGFNRKNKNEGLPGFCCPSASRLPSQPHSAHRHEAFTWVISVLNSLCDLSVNCVDTASSQDPFPLLSLSQNPPFQTHRPRETPWAWLCLSDFISFPRSFLCLLNKHLYHVLLLGQSQLEGPEADLLISSS